MGRRRKIVQTDNPVFEKDIETGAIRNKDISAIHARKLLKERMKAEQEEKELLKQQIDFLMKKITEIEKCITK